MKLQYFAMSALTIILAGPFSGPASADTTDLGPQVAPIPDKAQVATSSKSDSQAVVDNSTVRPTTLKPSVTDTGNPPRTIQFFHPGGGNAGGHGH